MWIRLNIILKMTRTQNRIAYWRCFGKCLGNGGWRRQCTGKRQSSFKIHVNGKPNNMMSNNPKEVLKSMPANTIKYIEVITSPGAKYDAEGIGGILNIVTVGSGFEGTRLLSEEMLIITE